MTKPRAGHQKQWTVVPPAPPEFLARFPELPNLVSHLLYHRGVRTQEEIDAFLNPDYGTDLHDPFLFRDMRRAVDRCIVARDRGERILVHGDYDADGVSGATVLLDTLEGIGCSVDAYIPHRERDGYGFNPPAVAYAQSIGARLIITCDCGGANAKTVAGAAEVGIDVIVTDHHLIPVDAATGQPIIPSAYAILHPKIVGETYPYAELTGGGVAFKLCQAIVRHDAASSSPRLPAGFEKWLLDCTAISTVADYGPLVGENRTLVTYGLVVLGKTRRAGLRCLYEVAGIKPERITPATIGFQIAPRINAAGRIDHANEALALLRCRDPQEARALAEKLNATNAERQRLVEVACDEAVRSVETKKTSGFFLVIVGDDWIPGIVGLVATRLRDRFHRPAIALTRRNGQLLGSGRSIPELNIVDALRAHAELLGAFGGHPQACGLTVKGEAELSVLTERLEAYARERLTPEQLTPSLTIDRELTLGDVTWDLVALLTKLGPFGIGNPTPRYLTRGVVVDDVRTMGNSGKHLRLQVHQDGNKESGIKNKESKIPDSRFQIPDSRRKLVCFSYEDICPSIRVGDVVDVVYEVDVNEWNGNREIQMKVVDLRPAEHSVS
ncbi:single-stranded-DNA-specific exonuclease RecJ [Candidatus Uhrbacteria bacterium]|nr:single-stranded-DNA-specific exonuclease RecJ [Candidatus Uhrbacteria bacterium]